MFSEHCHISIQTHVMQLFEISNAFKCLSENMQKNSFCFILFPFISNVRTAPCTLETMHEVLSSQDLDDLPLPLKGQAAFQMSGKSKSPKGIEEEL